VTAAQGEFTGFPGGGVDFDSTGAFGHQRHSSAARTLRGPGSLCIQAEPPWGVLGGSHRGFARTEVKSAAHRPEAAHTRPLCQPPWCLEGRRLRQVQRIIWRCLGLDVPLDSLEHSFEAVRCDLDRETRHHLAVSAGVSHTHCQSCWSFPCWPACSFFRAYQALELPDPGSWHQVRLSESLHCCSLVLVACTGKGAFVLRQAELPWAWAWAGLCGLPVESWCSGVFQTEAFVQTASRKPVCINGSEVKLSFK
jgi:hypothetical protein